ncbi:MAG TPA: TonB family protein [Bryobacteraceae bacterium]|nr:TonB family protein [Bryobacteraceae bacterium]
MNLDNAAAWSLQIAVVVAAAGLAATVLRLRAPGARLLYWQMALLASLVLPFARPWRERPMAADVSVSNVVLATGSAGTAHHLPTLREAALWLLLAGIGLRLLWLSIGLWRLGRYRRQSTPFGERDGAALLLSEAIASPVTFGARRPVVLLPARFPEFDAVTREAILCHELLHVRRRDWLYTLAEEVVRAIFWFHPFMWWLLGEIALAREEEVDRLAVAQTRARDKYVDALLAIAGAGSQPDLAPAPLFLRKRHLKRRVLSILKEVRMSKTRLVSSLAGALGILVAACWLAAATFPLSAASDSVTDSPGVQVDTGGAPLMHRAPVLYPESARKQGISGTVAVQAAVDASGDVTDAQVLSGPQELRKAALQSVLQWHFEADAGARSHQVTISFQPSTAPAVVPPAASPGIRLAGSILSHIVVIGISDAARAQLLAQLPVHPGDKLQGSSDINRIRSAVANFDPHLTVSFLIPVRDPNQQSPSEVAIKVAPRAEPSTELRVGGNVQAAKLIFQPRPTYPAEAKQAHIQGVVKLDVSVAADGTVQNIDVVSGHPLLVPAAVEAVKQWVYQPTLLNGNPVPVETEVDVNFTLSQ